jgi:centrosomal protein CEP290
VADLEEERRKLRLEMKFRAKYHGAAALELGLSPEQLLLVEQYVEGLRSGRSTEGNLVAQLTKRVRGCLPGPGWPLPPPPCIGARAICTC